MPPSVATRTGPGHSSELFLLHDPDGKLHVVCVTSLPGSRRDGISFPFIFERCGGATFRFLSFAGNVRHLRPS